MSANKDKLGGADLHNAIKTAVVEIDNAKPTGVNSGKVKVNIDKTKLTNFTRSFKT